MNSYLPLATRIRTHCSEREVAWPGGGACAKLTPDDKTTAHNELLDSGEHVGGGDVEARVADLLLKQAIEQFAQFAHQHTHPRLSPELDPAIHRDDALFMLHSDIAAKHEDRVSGNHRAVADEDFAGLDLLAVHHPRRVVLALVEVDGGWMQKHPLEAGVLAFVCGPLPLGLLLLELLR
eukprot:CAMPEP_0202052110 /NCGR_PEP_ID=MMETSP0963-20130614/5046_1 /ASSEMBLY_ACC=CAM_ASM_000494 /TAXON_ID=4773 /ORGANISM="Schizochytrium aggregatum, Strain ATCC28209" /LENGTH=178 /DNA_ID=CAMNT_0048617343 /DNA_START=325 /DNA_END=862 /DNA_ORIENTATION=-